MYCSVVLCTHLAVGQNNFLHYAHLFDHNQWASRSNKFFDEFVSHTKLRGELASKQSNSTSRVK